jgi:hypothetical protein
MNTQRAKSEKEIDRQVTPEHTRERGEERAVGGFEARTCDLALQDRELMAQHEDFDILGTIRATAQNE